MLNDAAYPGKFLFLGAFRKRPARTQALADGGQIARIFKRGGVAQSDGKFEICPPDLYLETYSLHLRLQGCPSSALVTEQIKAQTLLHHYKLYSTL